MVRFPTRWSDFWPLALLPTKWLDFLPPEVVGNPTNCAPGMEAKHCTMGKLFCESCIRHVLSGSRNCHFHFLFFVLQLLPWIVKHCLVVCLFLVHTEDRSLKAYFYIFISLQIFIQFKLNVWDNKAISGAAESCGGSAAGSPSGPWIQPQDTRPGKRHMDIFEFSMNNANIMRSSNGVNNLFFSWIKWKMGA